MLFVTNASGQHNSLGRSAGLNSLFWSSDHHHQDQSLEYLQVLAGIQDRDVLETIDEFFVVEIKEGMREWEVS
jgi:hypothetical protein